MTPHDFESLQSWMCQEAIALVGYPDSPASAAFKVMATEPDMLLHWWDGAFEQSEQENALLNSAARAIARREPLPELSFAQRGRLALRLRLASRILRALSSKHENPPKGWFPTRLRKMSEPDLLEWLLIDAWAFCSEIFDETLSWADEFEHPFAPSTKRHLRQISSQDSASFSE